MRDPIEIAGAVYCPDRQPTGEECRKAINECAEAVAAMFLADRGMTFRKAGDPDEACRIYQTEQKELLDDPEGLAACLMQVKHIMGEQDEIANLLCGVGDDHFYNQVQHKKYSRQKYALYCYQLAAGLDSKNQEALWEAISVCWQGNWDTIATRFKTALPYAVVLAKMDPRRDEVQAIMRRIAENGSAF